MKGFLQIAVVVIITIVLTTTAILNASLGTISKLSFNSNVGTTLTTISSATKISDLATILPDNFNALNAGKIEVSTTTLPLITTMAGLATTTGLSSIGTINTGVWNGTTMGVAYGGTGTTTWSDKQLIIGNGTSGFQVIGFGASGQVLKSNGEDTLASWSSGTVDEGINYDWTGYHTFTFASTTYATTTVLTAGILFDDNGIQFTLPSTQGASSTVLKTDGAGNTTWQPEDWYILGETTLTASNATATVSSISASQELMVKIYTPIRPSAPLGIIFNNDYSEAVELYYSKLYYDYTITSDASAGTGVLSSATTSSAYMSLEINNSASSTKHWFYTGTASSTDGAMGLITGVGSWGNATEQITRVDIFGIVAAPLQIGTTVTVYGRRN